jgi:small subunit ribosomal protein S1
LTVERMEQADQADATKPEPATTTQAADAESSDNTPTEPATSQQDLATRGQDSPTAQQETVAADASATSGAAAETESGVADTGIVESAPEPPPLVAQEEPAEAIQEAAPVQEAPAEVPAPAAEAAPETSATVGAAEAEAAEPAEPGPLEPTVTPTAESAEPAPVEPTVAPTVDTVAETPTAPAPAARPAPTVFEGPEPTTMEELLNQQQTEIKSLKHGDVVEGAVVRIDKDEILVDIGAKSEGVISNRELYGRNAETQPELHIGDTVLVYVLQPESPEGHAVLSLRRAGLERKWRAMQEQLEAGAIIEAPVIDHNKGGLIVDCGIRGFVPISQIVDFPRRPQNEQPRDAAQEIAEKLQPYVGRKLRLKILEVNRKANRLILSEKVALYEERREKRDELFSSLQVGQKVTGTVRSIAPFGIFVDLGGIDGLVHKSELSWNKVNNPEAGYRVGEDVEAEVIDINHERGRISLSIRRLQPDPWHSTVADLKVGDVIDGTVTKIVNFGAFVRVRDGLEGLIHISELSHQRVAHPGDVVHEGQTLKLKVISLEQERHRLGLSLKQAEEAPARAEPGERRERRSRGDRSYDMSQAVQEPEGGIDNTLAAAFAQVRQQMQETEAARGKSVPGEEPSGEQPVSEQAQTEEPRATAEPAEAKAEPAEATAEPAEPTAEPAEATAEPAEATAEPAEATAAPAEAAEVAQEQPEPEHEAEAAAAATAETAEAEPEPRRSAPRKGRAKAESPAGEEAQSAAAGTGEDQEAAES